MNKKLIAYFSATGVTKIVAEKIKEVVDGDLFEIKPVELYTREDLDWTNKESRSSIEMRDGIKPEVVDKVSNLDLYDTVYLGFPIWWDKQPTIINKFLEENDLSNKKVYVFVTSGGSTIDGTHKSIVNDFPNLNFVSGRRFRSTTELEEIKEWIETN